ncbi:MAG: YhdP family protein, partial [Motiliproteus sp.]|nr:YhdP family protein [Motiliproteus sp.]
MLILPSLKRLLHIKLSVIVACVVLLALLVSATRLLMFTLPDHRERIESWLSDETFSVSIGELRGQWNNLLPALDASGVVLKSPQGDSVFELGKLQLELDLLETLWRGKAIFHRIVLDRLELQLLRTKENGWQVQGVASGSDSGEGVGAEKLLRRLVRHGEIRLVNAIVQVHFEDGPSYPPQVINATLQSQGDRFSLQTQLEKVGGKVLDFRLLGRGLPGSEQFRGNFYLHSPQLGMRFWRQFLPPEYAELKQFDFSTRLWGHIEGALPVRISGEVSVPQLRWQNQQGQIQVNDISTRLSVQQREGRWKWQLDELKADVAGIPLPMDKVYGEWQPEKKIVLSSDRLDVGGINGILLANGLTPEAITSRLSILQPLGLLRNIRSEIDLSEQAEKLFRLNADLDNVEVSSWQGAPEIRGVNGLIQVDESGGSVSFDNRDMVLNFPDLYQQGWTLKKAQGRVSWQIDSESVQVFSGLLTASLDGVDAHGRFSLDVPFAEELPSDFTLMIGMDNSNGALAPLFVPDKVIDPALFGWLSTSIKAGQLNSGGFIYQGALESWASAPSIQMYFDVSDGRIKYQPDWPEAREAKAFTMVKNTQVLVDIYEGKIYDTDILSGQVYLPPDSSVLQVRADIAGPAADGRRVLLEGPTKEYLGEEFAQWQLRGQAKTALDLNLDLDDLDRSKIKIISDVTKGRYYSEPLKFEFSDINGRVRYQHDKGLFADKLQARFFDQPIKVKVATVKRSDGAHTLISGNGRVDVARFNRWLKQPVLDLWQGQGNYQASLDICSSSPQCTTLEVNSDLVGIESVDVPQPYAKESIEKRPLKLRMNLTGQRNWLRINYGDQFKSLFALQEGITGGEIIAGYNQGEPRPLRKGLRIRGAVSELDPQPWQRFLDRMFPETVSSDGRLQVDPILKSVDLEAGRLILGEERFDDVHALFLPIAGGWQLQLDAPAGKGLVSLPRDQSQPYRISLQRLYLPDQGDGDSDAVAPDKIDPLKDFDPATLPPMEISVEDFRLGEDDFGRWKLRVEPVSQGVHITGIEGIIRALDSKADLWWRNSGNGHQTSIELDLKAKQLADVQRAWGQDPVLESKWMELKGNLAWQGSPLNFNVASLDGVIDLKTGQGRFIDTDAAGGAIKLFGLLNFKALGRRLRLDFTDLSKKGLSFDKITGAYRIEEGMGHSTQPLKIEGPSAGLELSGSFDMNAETLDQRMTVTLPLAESLSL